MEYSEEEGKKQGNFIFLPHTKYEINMKHGSIYNNTEQKNNWKYTQCQTWRIPHTLYKNELEQIAILNAILNPETIQCLKEHMGEHLCIPELGKGFLEHKSTKCKRENGWTGWQQHYKLVSSLKDTITKNKRPVTDKDKISPTNISDKGLASKIYKYTT